MAECKFIERDILKVKGEAMLVPTNPGCAVGEGFDSVLDEESSYEFGKMREKLLQTDEWLTKPGTVATYPCPFELSKPVKYIIMAVVVFDKHNPDKSLKLIQDCYTKAVEQFSRNGGGILKTVLLGAGHLNIKKEIAKMCAKKGIEAAKNCDNVKVIVCLKDMEIKTEEDARNYARNIKKSESVDTVDEEEAYHYMRVLGEYRGLELAVCDVTNSDVDCLNKYFEIQNRIDKEIDKKIYKETQKRKDIDRESLEREYKNEKIEAIIDRNIKKCGNTMVKIEEEMKLHYSMLSKYKTGKKLTRENAILLGVVLECPREDRISLICLSQWVVPYPLDNHERILEKILERYEKEKKPFPSIGTIDKEFRENYGLEKGLYEYLNKKSKESDR